MEVRSGLASIDESIAQGFISRVSLVQIQSPLLMQNRRRQKTLRLYRSQPDRLGGNRHAVTVVNSKGVRHGSESGVAAEGVPSPVRPGTRGHQGQGVLPGAD